MTPLRPEIAAGVRLLLELQPIEHHLAATREERLIEQQQANRELIRNLAHEIKNPLGGIRGAAQLLEHELGNPSLKEYTQVIIKEADRLQDLMQRLLTPHRPMLPATVNIHEILEAGAQPVDLPSSRVRWPCAATTTPACRNWSATASS